MADHVACGGRCGTAVRNWSSTCSRPRSSALRPAKFRSSLSGGTHPSDREQRHVGNDALPRFQVDDHSLRFVLGDIQPVHRFPRAKDEVAPPELMQQLVHDLLIQKFQRTATLVDQRHPHAERREDRGVFGADDSGAHHSEGLGDAGQPDDVVAGDDRLPRRLAIPREGAGTVPTAIRMFFAVISLQLSPARTTSV